MLNECLEVFEYLLKEKGDSLILGSYVPADGTYLYVGRDGEIKEVMEIKIDRKTKMIDRSNAFFSDFCFCDYHSQLISMNKPVDGKKVVHSNNYLSFFVKKESITTGKLTDELIDGYYDVLKDPMSQKYKKSREAARIYELFEAEEGKVDTQRLEEAREWVKTHIYSLEDVDMNKKDYLKIFFEEEKEKYEREGRRYFLPNIYNSNDYNVEIQNTVYGLPDNNLGMNAKKPFLALKSRKYPAPYLLDKGQAVLQKKFFDYLMNRVSAGECHIYVDTEQKQIEGFKNGEAAEQVLSGYYLHLRKGKTEAEIVDQDHLSGYRQKLKNPFDFQEIVLTAPKMREKYQNSYGKYHTRISVSGLISEVLFSNCLTAHYLTKPAEIRITDALLKRNILMARKVIFDWVYKGRDRGFAKILQKISLEMIKDSLLIGRKEKALWQLNLRWSFLEYFVQEGEGKMAEFITELTECMERKVLGNSVMPPADDREYYYAVGQMVSYLISLSKSKDSKQSLINPFLNARTDEYLKKRIVQLYKRYNYAIPEYSGRVKNLLAMVEGYRPDGDVDQEMIILGYASDNLIYKSKEKRDE